MATATYVGSVQLDMMVFNRLALSARSWRLWLGFQVRRSAMSFPCYLSHSARPPLRQRMPLGRLGVLCRSRPRLCRMCPASG
jgi:hypothetical protein